MLLYLDHAWEKFKTQGSMNRIEDLYAAVIEGAVQRIRSKIMTLCPIIFGLLPIMWSPVYQAGAHVMKRIATPMIGGVITLAILNLLIYVIWRKRSLPAEPPAGSFDGSSSRCQCLLVLMVFLLTGIAIASGYFAWASGDL